MPRSTWRVFATVEGPPGGTRPAAEHPLAERMTYLDASALAGRLGPLESDLVGVHFEEVIDPDSITGNDLVADLMGCARGDLRLSAEGRLLSLQTDPSEGRPEILAVQVPADYSPGGFSYAWKPTPRGVDYYIENTGPDEKLAAAIRRRFP